jgi:lipopolysaccharide export system ATP-binding protein
MLAAAGLRKSFRGRAVVRDFAFELREGEIVGLLGPNGAGKTTCFYMIVGLVAADDGVIRIDDRDVTALPMHARARLGLGYLPQEPSVFRRLSVARMRTIVVLPAPLGPSSENTVPRGTRTSTPLSTWTDP